MRRTLLIVLGSACLWGSPVSAQSRAVAATAPTFNKDVAPILYANCITCHRPGEIAPMSLLTYQEARPWARGIKAKVTAREMPPWFADPRYGKFKNARGLTQAQIDTLVAWVDAGSPQGTGPAPTAPNVINDSAAGTLTGFMDRPADAVIEAPFEAEIPPVGDFTGLDLWQKPPFTEDKALEAAEIRPTNRAVTHHSQVGAVGAAARGASHRPGAGVERRAGRQRDSGARRRVAARERRPQYGRPGNRRGDGQYGGLQFRRRGCCFTRRGPAPCGTRRVW